VLPRPFRISGGAARETTVWLLIFEGSNFRSFHTDPLFEKIRGTGVFRLVVQELRREFARAQDFQFKISTKVRACADSRRNSWTTNLKTPVTIFVAGSLLKRACADLPA
jgi:hypothetical protein